MGQRDGNGGRERDRRPFDPAGSDQTVTGAERPIRCSECGDQLSSEDGWRIRRTRHPDLLVCPDCAERILDLPV